MLTGATDLHGHATRAALDDYLAAGDSDGPGLYLTNDAFLYRVVRIVSGDAGAMVDVEDCYSLDVVRVPIHALHAVRLRIVTASPLQS